MAGYDITCDPGDLYTRRCYDKDGHDIVAYTSKGQPIGYDGTTGKTYLTALDSAGNAFSPYPQGMPYTLNDSGAISNVAGKWRLSSGADPQWITRLVTLPGAQARIKAATTTVPWYYDTFGLRKRPMPSNLQAEEKSHTLIERFFSQLPELKTRGGAARTAATVGALGVVGVVLVARNR